MIAPARLGDGMRKFLLLLTAVSCIGLAAHAARATTQTSDPAADIERERAALADAVERAREPKPDAPAIEAALKAVIADAAFAELSEPEQHAAYLVYGATLYDQKKYEEARTPIRQASEMQEAAGFDWDLRARNSYALKDYADAAHALVSVAAWPDGLMHYRDEAVFRLVEEARASDAHLADTLLDALLDAKWTPKDPFQYRETDLWLGVLKKRLEAGDVAGAAKAAGGLRDPAILIELRADKRYDKIVQAMPDRFDVMKAYADELASRRDASEKAPQMLKDINRTADTLIRLNRPKEALTLLSEAIARVESRPSSFADEREQMHWSYDEQSSAFFTTGRIEDGFAAMRKGAEQTEYGRANVSEAINLAGKYEVYERPRDALEAIDSVGDRDVSTYGRMALEDARACAYFELGDKSDFADSLKYLKAHSGDGMQPFLDALLLTGDLDGAAAFVIASLRDPTKRMDILYYLQDYAPAPFPSARERAMHANLLAVRSRPDVAQEIADVGRVEYYPILTPSF